MIGGVIAVLGGTAVYITLKPRVQLTGRSIAYLSMAISKFISEQGRMPTGIDELETHGLLVHTAGGDSAIPIGARNPSVLYYLQDIVVNWSPDLDKLQLVEERLLDRQSGRPVYLIQVRFPYSIGHREHCMDCSVRWYQALEDEELIRTD